VGLCIQLTLDIRRFTATSATVQPVRVVQPDAVCEVGGSTPGLSHGDLGVFLGGGQQRNLYIS